MPKIEFVKTLRDCPANERRKIDGQRGLIYDYNVLIDGEHRVTLARNTGALGYELRTADPDVWIAVGNSRHNGIKVENKEAFERTILMLLASRRIPTLAQIAAARKERELEAERQSAEQAEERRNFLIKEAGVDLYKALKYIALHSGEKTIRAKAEAAIAKAERRENV